MPWGMQNWTGRFDDPSYASPFAQELYQGYMRFKTIDDGTMWKMIQPGASGVGLHVGQLMSPDCCGGYIQRAYDTVAYKDSYNPWLYPSLVTWESIMDGKLAHHDYIHAMAPDYPMVAITSVNPAINDFRWALSNLNYEYDTDRDTYEPNSSQIELGGSLVLGTVPLWTVIPLSSEERVTSLINTLKKFHNNTNLELLSECWCTIDGIECDGECESQGNLRAECTCKVAEILIDELTNMYSDPVDVTNYMDDSMRKIWQYAIHRFYDGWQILNDTIPQGEEWASYWQQQQSPFLVSPGQSFRDLLDSTNSINSVTQQAS